MTQQQLNPEQVAQVSDSVKTQLAARGTVALRDGIHRSRRRATVALCVLASLVLMFGTGYVSGLNRGDHATIGNETVPRVHCQEDEAITWVPSDATPLSLGCVHIETITQQELDRVQSLRDAGYDVEGYR